MRNPGAFPRLRSAEECIVMMRLNPASSAVVGVCIAVSGVVMAMAWRVLAG